MTAGRPLEGLRVLDFAWIGAGALVTKALAELGAEVVRIESRARPDNLRLSPPFRPGTSGLDASGYFASRNSGKHSVALDMKHPRARDIALRFVEVSDVLTSNFRTGVLDRWGLGYDAVRAVNPRLVYLVMPMQGTDGPHRDHVGFGSTIAALAGLVHPSGLPGRTPVGTGTHYPDHVPNPGHALVALLAAIFHQRATGEGQLLELSQLESTINVLGPGVLNASIGGEDEAVGNRSPGGLPRNTYRCADDRWLAISCRTEGHWQALCEALDRKPLLVDPRFVTPFARAANLDALDVAVAERVAAHDRPALLDRLRAAGVPAAPVNDARDMLEDEDLRARGFWNDVDHAVIGSLPMFHLPFVFDGVERTDVPAPPLLGEHTEEVVTRVLGLTDDEYRELVEDGVFH